MNAKEELKNILIWEAKIEGKAEQIKRLESLAMKTTSAMGGEAVSRTRDNDPHGRYMVKKEKLEREVAKLQAENERRKDVLSHMIDNLRNPVHIRVLYGLFYNKKSLTKIAGEIDYSYRHVINLRDDGIAEVQKIIDARKISLIS